MAKDIRITFVCMGNICRSPTAHGVLRKKLQDAGLQHRVKVDSAGTHGYHQGEAPDQRAQAHARARGYEIGDLRSRRLRAADFVSADLLLVMDGDNLAEAASRCPGEHRHKLRRLTDFLSVSRSADVPDPYYGPPAGFERVLDLLEDACDGLIDQLRDESA